MSSELKAKYRTSWIEDIGQVIDAILKIVKENGSIYDTEFETFKQSKGKKIAKCRRPFNGRLYIDEKEERREQFGPLFKRLEEAKIVCFKTLKVDDFLLELNYKSLYAIEFKTLQDLARSTMTGHMHKQIANKLLLSDFRYLGEFGKTRLCFIYQKQSQAEARALDTVSSTRQPAKPSGPQRCAFKKYAIVSSSATNGATRSKISSEVATSIAESRTQSELPSELQTTDDSETNDPCLIGNTKWFDGQPLDRKQVLGSKRHRFMQDGMTVLMTEHFEHTAYELLSMLLESYKSTEALEDRYEMERQPYLSIDKFEVSLSLESMTEDDQIRFLESREDRSLTKQQASQLQISEHTALFINQLRQVDLMSIEMAYSIAIEFETSRTFYAFLSDNERSPQVVVNRIANLKARGSNQRIGPQMAIKLYNAYFHSKVLVSSATDKIINEQAPIQRKRKRIVEIDEEDLDEEDKEASNFMTDAISPHIDPTTQTYKIQHSTAQTCATELPRKDFKQTLQM